MIYDSEGNVVQGSLITQIQRKLAFSTTTPLGANAVYTSPTIDAINYKYSFLRIFSDQAGTCAVQQSDDGLTWDTVGSLTTTANTPLLLNTGSTAANLILRYVRFVYTNGATVQTVFRMSSYLSPL